MRVGVTIDGLQQIETQLRTLPVKAQKTVVRKAVRIALKPMQTEARRKAVSVVGGETGSLLARHVVIAAPKRQRPGTYALHVQMRRGVPEFVHVTKDSKQHYLPTAIEFGHGSDKASAARPFLRPAAHGRQDQVRRDFMKEMGNGLLREAIKGRYR